MSSKETGGSAFPMQDQQAIHAIAAAAIVDIHDNADRDRAYTLARAQAIGGMTLRDYFAVKAMAVFLPDGRDDADTARQAYAMADAMLEARK